MILEVAQLQINPDRDPQIFWEAMATAAPLIARAKGYIQHTVYRCQEVPDRYLLLVQWQSVEDHMVGFRNSADFGEWRRILGPFFAAPPVVEHFEGFYPAP
ncbi:MAG: antibiotic biosynthesis monooxygenase [Synechococcales cyanobacterium]